jgi:hypothetical protein
LDLPREFSVQAAPGPTRYLLADQYFAVPARAAERLGLRVEFRLEDGQLAVCQGAASHELREQLSEPITPVYRLGEHGALAVPTGRVFLRLAEGVDIDTRRASVEAAGFVVQQRLAYAPHAGWLAPRSGQVQDALNGFNRLLQIADVQAVEPQMLMPSERR